MKNSKLLEEELNTSIPASHGKEWLQPGQWWAWWQEVARVITTKKQD